MADVGSWIVAVVERFGYAGVALLIALENLVPPIPSEVVLPMAGFAVSRGTLTFTGAVAAATAGSVGGALAIYGLGRRVGARRVGEWMDRHGRWLFLSGSDVDRAQDWFDRHGAWAVLLGRLVPGIRSYVSFPAGFARMGLARFVAYTAIGSAAWNALLVGLGLQLGARWHAVSGVVDKGGWIVWTLIAVAFVWLAVRRRGRRKAGGGRGRGRHEGA